MSPPADPPALPEEVEPALLDRVQAGDGGAFDELYHACVDRVHRKLWAMVGPDAELEDLVQQAFLHLHRGLPKFRRDARFSTWLYRLTTNVALEHLRKRKRKRWLLREVDLSGELPEQVTRERPEGDLDRRRELTLLSAVLEHLKPKKRIAFVLYEIEGHTLEEISAMTNAPLPTVAARLRAARQEISKAIERRAKQQRRLPGSKRGEP